MYRYQNNSLFLREMKTNLQNCNNYHYIKNTNSLYNNILKTVN